MLRPKAFPRITLSPRSFRRSIHRLPPLEQFEDGIPGLFTPDGFKVAWTEHQTLMIEKLNALTAGSADDYSSTTKNILLKYARQPNMASLFNHASMAHNNHFFFSTLSTEPTVMPSSLQKSLETSFSSVETLKREFIATANSMFGPGFVWLVKSGDKYSLLNTYIAGSPYAGAHWRKQTRDMNTETNINTTADVSRQRAIDAMPISNTVGQFGPLSANKTAPGGINITPVLCVSTWQHVYIMDWGLSNKKQFLEAWWDRIDWNVVANAAGAKTGSAPFVIR